MTLSTGGGAKRRDNPWLSCGPYRMNVAGVDGTPWAGDTVNRPLYYSDWYTVEDYEKDFFNVLCEIRDVNGYEWFNFATDDSQYTDVEKAITYGTKIFKRCFDSKVLGNLFTHEDAWRGKFIANIRPRDWEKMISGVVSNIRYYNPHYTTVDHAVKYVRGLHESRLAGISYLPKSNSLNLNFLGRSDIDTSITLYTNVDGYIVERTYNVSQFEKGGSFNVCMKNESLPVLDTIYGSVEPAEKCETKSPTLLGTRFYPLVNGVIEKVRFYRFLGDNNRHIIYLINMVSKKHLVEPLTLFVVLPD